MQTHHGAIMLMRMPYADARKYCERIMPRIPCFETASVARDAGNVTCQRQRELCTLEAALQSKRTHTLGPVWEEPLSLVSILPSWQSEQGRRTSGMPKKLERLPINTIAPLTLRFLM